MGSSSLESVVDENGETWNCSNLYVCDASVFPTSSGVNPMLTTLAIADGVAEGIAKEMLGRSESERETRSKL
jgi:choline dehydrogenase-like flavoprotein